MTIALSFAIYSFFLTSIDLTSFILFPDQLLLILGAQFLIVT